jgi:3-oxoacyl-[acyl-carrier-protein] synthase-3
MNLEENKRIKAAITAVGGYVPETILSNQDLEKMVDTNDAWITSRTGIKERRILKDNQKATSYLAIKAAENLLSKNAIDPTSLDLLIVATVTPDMPVAATAAYVASEIGATNAFAFDLNAACSGLLIVLLVLYLAMVGVLFFLSPALMNLVGKMNICEVMELNECH